MSVPTARLPDDSHAARLIQAAGQLTLNIQQQRAAGVPDPLIDATVRGELGPEFLAANHRGLIRLRRSALAHDTAHDAAQAAGVNMTLVGARIGQVRDAIASEWRPINWR